MVVNMSQEKQEGQANVLTMQSTLTERDSERQHGGVGGGGGNNCGTDASLLDTQNAIGFLPVINVCH